MSRTRTYIANVLWSWAGVGLTIVIGFLLSPYIIRRIGDTNFSIWALALSLVEYYWLIDFGFRSATIKLSAQYRTTGEDEKRNVLLSTGVLYTSIAAVFITAGSLLGAPYVARIFKIDQPDFLLLVRVVGVSWAIGMVLNIFSACLEGYQRFDLTNRVWIISMAVRSVGILFLLSRGGGVRQMGFMLLAAQCTGYFCTYLLFRSAVPGAMISYGRSSLAMMREMARYGVHTFTTIASNLLLNRSVPVLIAFFMPVRYLAYWTIPVRILEYAADGIGRIGMVTAPNATELMTQGRSEALVRLGVYTNRYCFGLFAPIAVFLLSYGFQLYSLWIRPDFARQCAYLLPVLLIGQTLLAGQSNSISILFGIGRHKWYSRALLVEAILTVMGLSLVLKPFGLYGAAWVTSILMSGRSAMVCWLLSREMGVSPVRYAARIYASPALVGAIAWGFAMALRNTVLAGRTWPELIAAGVLMTLLYGALAFRFCLAPHHRELALEKVRTAAVMAGSLR